MGYIIREINVNDFDGLMQLYTELHNNELPIKTDRVIGIWNKVLNDKDHHVIIADDNGNIVSSCVLVVVPNLTHAQRPYALIENVVTKSLHRRKGLATQCLNYAAEIAKENNCYKIMLLTGAKDSGTLDFYRQAGYNGEDKKAFIKWL